MESSRSPRRLDVDALTLECLGCGTSRGVPVRTDRKITGGTCSRCGDVGWARPDDLTQRDRRLLHAARAIAASRFAA